MDLLWQTFREWREDRASAQGAALAFYALFSLAPLGLVLTAVLGSVVGEDAVEERLARELAPLVTPEIAATVRALVAGATDGESGLAASGIGLAVSVYAGMRGFFHLQATLNYVWGVRAIRGPGLFELVRRKLLAFASVTLCGALLVASIGATLVLHPIAERATADLDSPYWLARRSEDLFSFVLVTFLLSVVFKSLPDVRIRWRDVLTGALVSAVLFVAGKHGIAWYLRNGSTASSFGAAGTIVAVLLFVQYSAQAVLFGAKFAYVFARHRGQPLVPGPGAARVVRTVLRDEGPR